MVRNPPAPAPALFFPCMFSPHPTSPQPTALFESSPLPLPVAVARLEGRGVGERPKITPD